MNKKSSQVDTESSQAGDLTYDEWMRVLQAALAEPGPDGYLSRRELAELTGLSTYALDRRLDVLLKNGQVEAGKGYRKGPTGFQQRVYVYRLAQVK